MQDKIFIEEIPTQAVIGIHDFEKAASQKLWISIEMGTDISQAAATDDVTHALNYDEISRFIDAFVRKTQVELLETLAERLAAELFQQFRMQSIKLTIRKPGAITYTQKVGLVIYRERS